MIKPSRFKGTTLEMFCGEVLKHIVSESSFVFL